MAKPKTFQRARRPEHKRQRRAAILAAARTLGRRHGVRNVTLGDVADAAGMAKSNVLRYFETREEIYLELATDGYAEWTAALAERLGDAPTDAGTVADALAATLADRPLLCDLIAQVSAALEHNISPELGRDFKLGMLGHIDDLGRIIGRALPELTGDEPFEAAAGSFIAVAGLWPSSNPPAEILALLEHEPGFARAHRGFQANLRRLLHVLLVGLPGTKAT